MPDQEMTDREKRNIDIVEKWMNCWNTKGQWMKAVDKIYADSPEVFAPLENLYFSRKDGTKANLRAEEKAYEDFFESREVRIDNILAKGDMVALEMSATLNAPGGFTMNLMFASFITINEDGRIVSEHSYHPPIKPEQLPPDWRKAYEKMVKEEN